MVTTITRDELKSRLDRHDAVTLVEALPAASYEQEHLPGALNLPHDGVDQLAGELLPDKAAAVVVYCANGPCANSGIAARRLEQLGYTDVADYALGKQDWIEAGLATEAGAAAVHR